MLSKSSEQFDVLSNTLRVLPEQVFRLNYFVNKVNDPEEGITNIEIACVNVFNQIYGMMCSLKDEGHTDTIYKHDAIATVLCIRHALQHQSGRLKNNIRDAFQNNIETKSILVRYSASDENFKGCPFYLNLKWIQESIINSNNAKRFPTISRYLNLEKIEKKARILGCELNACYLCAMSLITEAVRLIVVNYGQYFKPAGFDSEVYYKHFATINVIDPNDFGFSIFPDDISKPNHPLH